MSGAALRSARQSWVICREISTYDRRLPHPKQMLGFSQSLATLSEVAVAEATATVSQVTVVLEATLYPRLAERTPLDLSHTVRKRAQQAHDRQDTMRQHDLTRLAPRRPGLLG